MKHRIAIAAEGPSEATVLVTLCRKLDHDAQAMRAKGKEHLFAKFDSMLTILGSRMNATHFLVVADLHPARQCTQEADRWRSAIRERFPKAELCLSIWELEAWLLADPAAVEKVTGRTLDLANPDQIGDPRPSEILDRHWRQTFGYRRGMAYDKESDGKRLAEALRLEVATERSQSFAHLRRVVSARQERLT